MEAADLTRPLMAAFALGRSLPGYRLPLPAHARLAEVVSAEQLRWLLSSPLLLVLEAVTQSAAPLFSFLSSFPETGCVASWPDDILPWEDKSFTEFFKGGVSARLRRPVLVTPGPSPTALGSRRHTSTSRWARRSPPS